MQTRKRDLLEFAMQTLLERKPSKVDVAAKLVANKKNSARVLPKQSYRLIQTPLICLELAPFLSFSVGCRGFIEPVSPPLLIRYFVRYVFYHISCVLSRALIENIKKLREGCARLAEKL